MKKRKFLSDFGLNVFGWGRKKGVGSLFLTDPPDLRLPTPFLVPRNLADVTICVTIFASSRSKVVIQNLVRKRWVTKRRARHGDRSLCLQLSRRAISDPDFDGDGGAQAVARGLYRR